MKLIILVACALVAVAVAAPPPPSEYKDKEPEQIVRSSFDQTPEGGYNYGYETAKGSVREETGELKEALDEDNKPHLVIVVRGTYSYTDPEGGVQSIAYKADENGFEAVGDSIPKGPGAAVPTRR